MENNEDKFGPIRKGLLELVVLKIIKNGKVYAADILEKLKTTEFSTQDGTLYPLLSRFKREQLLSYEWVESESGPPRKYYSLTKNGEKRLQDLMNYWKELDKTIKKF
jgi:PadR family transcriptional regulator PadR